MSHEPCESWDREKDFEDLWKGDAVRSTDTLEEAFTQSHDGKYKMHYLEKSNRGKENGRERERDREKCQREKNLIGLILEGLPLCRLKSHSSAAH